MNNTIGIEILKRAAKFMNITVITAKAGLPAQSLNRKVRDSIPLHEHEIKALTEFFRSEGWSYNENMYNDMQIAKKFPVEEK